MLNQLTKDWILTEKLSMLKFLKPEYLEGKGDVTRCVFQSQGENKEEFHDLRPIKKLVDDLLLIFGKNKRSIQLSQQQNLDRSRNHPLVLNKHVVLIPVKLRKERIARDTSTGYLVLSQIANVLQDPNVSTSSWIFFTDGSNLHTFHSSKTVRDNMRLGRYALSDYNQQENRGMPHPFPPDFFTT